MTPSNHGVSPARVSVRFGQGTPTAGQYLRGNLDGFGSSSKLEMHGKDWKP